jgi:soluble lytic murein transglycosylase-like protein
MLTFCANLYANGYNITINVDGEEYYSDRNGYSEEALAAKSGKKSVSRKHKDSVAVSDDFVSVPEDGPISKKKKKYTELIAKAADKHQVDAKLVHAVIQAESAYNSKAISSAGAVGLMQLMPGTARRYGVTDRSDPYQSIEGGTHYLKDLLQLFDSDLNLAVAAYNAGENAVIKHNKSIPPYRETRDYVKKVLSLKDLSKLGARSEYGAPGGTDATENWGNSGYTIEINYP